jgi:hypothetical protein
MGEHASDKFETVIPFAPAPKAVPEGNLVAEDSGRAIIALLQKAADMAKEDCARAMDVAHKLSFEIRTVEERARAAEAEAAHFRDRTAHAEAEAGHFRDRATRAEAWLMRIHSEVEQAFFQKNERVEPPRQPSVQPPLQRNLPPQPPVKDRFDPTVENDRAGRRR